MFGVENGRWLYQDIHVKFVLSGNKRHVIGIIITINSNERINEGNEWMVF